MMENLAARALLALIWLLHWLPLGLQAMLGRGLGRVMHALARGRRAVALRNVELCLPELDLPARQALVREHFQWLARSLLERAVLWHASPERLRRLIHVEGDVQLAERSDRAVMWLVPHFLAVDVAGAATQLFQKHRGFDVYAPQSNVVLDQALLRGRARFGTADFYTRQDGARPIVRAIRQGHAFFNPCDMDLSLIHIFSCVLARLLPPNQFLARPCWKCASTSAGCTRPRSRTKSSTAWACFQRAGVHAVRAVRGCISADVSRGRKP